MHSHVLKCGVGCNAVVFIAGSVIDSQRVPLCNARAEVSCICGVPRVVRANKTAGVFGILSGNLIFEL